jgi:hypothetical protein
MPQEETIAETWRIGDLEFCAYCRRPAGNPKRATYRGAQPGGLPVHSECLADFFAALDREPFGNPHRDNPGA